jgi:hypothetical protein
LLPSVGEAGRRVAVELKGIPVVVFGVARKLENNVLGNVNGDDKAGNRIALVGENVVGVAAEAVRGRRHCGGRRERVLGHVNLTLDCAKIKSEFPGFFYDAFSTLKYDLLHTAVRGMKLDGL